MPKEEAKAFRKGTHSCVECRQRKLRCIPSTDGSQPCQNCTARGRECVLQTHAGRTGEPSGTTSRDRISHLENSVSQLWNIVGHLRTELGHPHDDRPPLLHTPSAASRDMESEATETSPLNPPTHLQQLFDNEFVDSQTPDAQSSTVGSERVSSAVLSRARSRLQALMPSKSDIAAICNTSMRWTTIYATLFPTSYKFDSLEDMLGQYDSLATPTASPVTVAALLVSVAITLVQRSSESSVPLSSIGDAGEWMKSVHAAVDETIVKEDDLACTIEGIETTLLFIRFQLVRTQLRTLWLLLRRVMALAELIGLPKVAQRAAAAKDRTISTGSDDGSYLHAAARLWKAICSIDRLVGTMFNLPFGTASYGLSAPQAVMSNGQVLPQEFFLYVAVIASKVQEIDEAYISRRPENEIIDMAFKTEQDLRTLTSMTPPSWWNLTSESPLPDHILQYWFYYFSVRTHLQLALRHGANSQHVYSYLTCYQASRAVAQRYVKIRALLPPAFFAGRVLDLQAFTGAVVLLFTSQRPAIGQGVSLQDDNDPPASQLVHEVIQTMESVANQATGIFGRQAAPALRSLDKLLNGSGRVEAGKNLSLHIPMLGKINVSRHAKPIQPTADPSGAQYNTLNSTQPISYPSASAQPPFDPGQVADLSTSGFTSDDLLSWSMDLMMDDFVPFPEDPFVANQYLGLDT